MTLRSGGVPESLPEGVEGRESIIEQAMTGATANVSCGALVD